MIRDMFLGTGGGMLRGGGGSGVTDLGSGAPPASLPIESRGGGGRGKQAHDVTAQPPPSDMKHDKRGGREEAVNKRGSERSIGPNLANAAVLAAIQQRAGHVSRLPSHVASPHPPLSLLSRSSLAPLSLLCACSLVACAEKALGMCHVSSTVTSPLLSRLLYCHVSSTLCLFCR